MCRLTKNKTLTIIFFSISYLLWSQVASAYTFAAIGDYGDNTSARSDVANRVDSWNPDFIITLGDNDYDGNYNESVVPYYGNYISSNCSTNRFYPSFGNHDWFGNNGYDDVFPCTGTNYKFTKGNVEFFTINSDNLSNSQINWLEDNLNSSIATFKVVFFHHPPYSSGNHGSQSFMQLDFASWGADVVLAGHDHHYERIERDGIVYFVNGLGGRGIYNIGSPITGSQKRYNSAHGAMRIDTTATTMRFRFINKNGSTIDDKTITASSTPPPSSNDILQNGVPITSLSGSKGTELHYTLQVPNGASNLSFNISGGSGDADLYVRFGAEPTRSAYDCRPYEDGNDETCVISNIQAGTYHVMLRGYSSFSNVNLEANYDENGTPPPPSGDDVLQNGVPITSLSGSSGTELHYTLQVPNGASNLSFNISGGSGDADLYVRFGAEPTKSTFDCRPYEGGNDETCVISNIQAGTYHVMLRGYSSFSNVNLEANYDENGTPPPPSGDDVLQNGVPITSLSGSTGTELHYTLQVPNGASNLSFNISGGSGDADLYVRFGAEPTKSTFDCRPYENGNDETCVISNIQAGTYHVMLLGYSSFSDVSLVGNHN